MGSAFLSWWSFSFDRTEARSSSVERGSVLQVHSASFPNTDRTSAITHLYCVGIDCAWRNTLPGS
jgi:hypothetical protein